MTGVQTCALPILSHSGTLILRNEDLDRDTAEKTAAVHFMRFELSPDMVAAVKAGAPISAGIDHANYQATVQVPDAARASLAADLA